MAKKFAEHNGLNLTQTNNDVLAAWEKNDIFHKSIDELYLWLSDPTVITYIRNALKRVRKKESALFLASQNLEDFTQPGIRELTRPLFSIPVHQFIFNGGNVNKKFFMDNLQLEESEYALIRDPQRGSCLYKCGNERYLLQVQAPEYKQALFGTAGGRE